MRRVGSRFGPQTFATGQERCVQPDSAFGIHKMKMVSAHPLARWCMPATSCLALALFSTTAHALPSFARETGRGWPPCHTVFPELTPFGREFKLNGYVIDNLKQIKGVTMERR